MLGRLMKYEFMATGRVFLPLFAALIVISIVNRLLSYLPTSTPSTIGTIVAVILMVGIGVLTFIITLQRFRSNLLSNEGYLMMTLPVSTDSLILSKLFVAAIWGVVSFIVVMISIVILASVAISLSDVAMFFRQVFELISTQPLRFIIYAIEILLIIALAIFSGILMLYACMALSMLVNRRRGLFTFGAFIVISTVLQIVVALIVALVVGLNYSSMYGYFELSAFGWSQLVIIPAILIEAATCAVLYFVTRYMLKNKLNLQ